MDAAIHEALARGHVIDITATGRTTGEPRRVEIVFHNIDGRIYITGMPVAGRTRAWLRNLEHDPRMTFHLKGHVRADLPATARVVTDPDERRRVFEWVTTNAWNQDPEQMQAHSPLIEVVFEAAAA
ncbi:MAG: nitroreductase/quinone reductase family protein [Candidatus Limnocylindria bacterium]